MSNSMDRYERWTLKDRIEFNRILIDECEVICQWTDQWGVCNEPVKGKDITSHLNHRHTIASESESYQCLWHGSDCSPKLMKKASLIRHFREQHLSVKWACLHCDQTFTRERTMMRHIRRSPGHPFPE
ncbi:hypothetical protein JVU11DRAFT_9946 [Chiua virens]|nr:hypothetical protein JVU11DRAFT_9946 [Chiua virens]